MVFSYQQVQEHPKLLLAMTSLTHAEFQQLLVHFQYAWDQYVQQHYVDRDDRQRQYGAGRSEATLVTLEDKLLFILYYVKVYPLQAILAFEYGMVQSTANEWIHILSEVLQKALDHGGGRRFQFGEGWHNSRHTVHFWNPLISFHKETDARCYASVTAYVMMIPACNSCSAQSKRPKRSRS